MSGEEEVIVIGGGGGGKRNASPTETTVKPQGWHNWKTVLKQYSTWVLGALAAVPDFLFMAFSWAVNFIINSPEGLYAAANAAGMLSDSAMPASITDFIRTVAISGLMLKFIKQQKPAE